MGTRDEGRGVREKGEGRTYARGRYSPSPGLLGSRVEQNIGVSEWGRRGYGTGVWRARYGCVNRRVGMCLGGNHNMLLSNRRYILHSSDS